MWLLFNFKDIISDWFHTALLIWFYSNSNQYVVDLPVKLYFSVEDQIKFRKQKLEHNVYLAQLKSYLNYVLIEYTTK